MWWRLDSWIVFDRMMRCGSAISRRTLRTEDWREEMAVRREERADSASLREESWPSRSW